MIHIDPDKATVTVESTQGEQTYPFASPQAFQILSELWLRGGWDVKQVYSFTWLGRPIIQLPEDMFRLQETIYQLKPDVIIETGVAHGGSLVFHAGLCQLIGKGHVIGIDIEIRPSNRAALEAHPLKPWMTLIEGSSTDPAVVQQAAEQIQPGNTVLVILDANHSKQHVLDELRSYGPLVSPGSYLIAADGIMQNLVGAPRSQADWATNNPQQAVQAFLQETDTFELAYPAFAFNESLIEAPVTYWPNGWLRKK